MKSLVIALTVLSSTVLSSVAMAASPALTENNAGLGQAFAYNAAGAPQASVQIKGEAARILYSALEVEPVGSFGIVQTQTKSTEQIECVQAILGDVKGTMSGPKYTCTILVDKK